MDAPRSQSRARIAGRGFSLIELIAVLVILTLLAGVAVPSYSKLTALRTMGAARVIAGDLNYARNYAAATGVPTWVVFSTGTNSYTLYAETWSNLGKANRAVMTDAATRKNFVRTFGGTGEFGGTTLSATTLTNSEVGFDYLGRAVSDSGARLSANATITLTGNGGATITLNKDSSIASVN